MHTYIYRILSVLALSLALLACAPTDKPSAPDAPKNPQVSEPLIMGQTFTIKSEVLGMDRRLTVRLPAGYKDEPNRRYDVVYVIDGGPEQDFPHIAGIAQSRDINWTFDPFILIGIETINRRYQITPKGPDTYEETLGTKPGGSDDFRAFIKNDVMPWAEGRYRTSDQNAVIGESLAGLFVVETLLKDPTLFNDYIAVSPSLWWDEMRLGKQAAADLAAMPAGKRRLYLTMADEGGLMQGGLDLLITALEAGAPTGLKWVYVERKNSESHASIYHGAALDAFRTFYLSAARTGGINPATFKDGIVPDLTDEALASLKQKCTKETAITVSFLDKNKDVRRWTGMCVMMKSGAAATKGNWGN